MFGRPGERDGRCLVRSALKLGGLGPMERKKVGMSKQTIVGGERVEGYLSGINGLCDVRPDTMSHQEVEPND